MTQAWTVSQFNTYVARILERDSQLKDVRIQGEISGLKVYPSGHIYFTLKDAQAAVSCVMFKSQAMYLRTVPGNGDQVVLNGRAALYERDGRFQIYVQKMELAGQGQLWQRFEALKSELAARGYFQTERKRPIPHLPRKIALITSPAGAVLHDILNVLKRRFEPFRIVLFPVAVQGATAAGEIASALEQCQHFPEIDVVIIARGGGSMEDLWAFNEAVVAEAIYHSRLPVISAVGHEVDFTIADFVADLRAPTPSAAAELVLPKYSDEITALQQFSERFAGAWEKRLRLAQERLEAIAERPALQSFHIVLERKAEDLDRLQEALQRAGQWRNERESERLQQLALRLTNAHPERPLERGFALLLDASGHYVTSVQTVSPGDEYQVKLKDGQVAVRAEKTSTDAN